MPITAEDIRATVDLYLAEHQAESTALSRLIAALDDRTQITSRAEFRGHVTCEVVLLNSSQRILHIHHNALGMWLPPGGHLEPDDTDLQQAALRELQEETGIRPSQLRPLAEFPAPFHIEVHTIPASAQRHEPEHHHFDFRYVFGADDDVAIDLQQVEVGDYRWLPVSQMTAGPLRDRLTAVLSDPPAILRRPAAPTALTETR